MNGLWGNDSLGTDAKKALCTHTIAILPLFSDILQVNQTLHLNFSILFMHVHPQ